VLTGSGFGKAISGPYQAEKPGRTGHMMIALDIEAFEPLREFNARMEELIAELKGVALANGFDEVVYPGELEARNDVKNRREGLILPPDTLQDLMKVAQESGCESLLPFDGGAL
jgi:LDH2 family malate/lactate/ureidoglycolate dehydrogenase